MTDSDALRRLALAIDGILHDKQSHFEQDDGTWYLRETGEYTTLEGMIEDVIQDVESFVKE